MPEQEKKEEDKLPVNELIKLIEEYPYSFGIGTQQTNLAFYYSSKGQPNDMLGIKLNALLAKYKTYNTNPLSYTDNVEDIFSATVVNTFKLLDEQEGISKYLGYLFIGVPIAVAGTLAAPLAGLLSWLIEASVMLANKPVIAALKHSIRKEAVKQNIPLDKLEDKPAVANASPALGGLGLPVNRTEAASDIASTKPPVVEEKKAQGKTTAPSSTAAAKPPTTGFNL